MNLKRLKIIVSKFQETKRTILVPTISIYCYGTYIKIIQHILMLYIIVIICITKLVNNV